MRREHNEKQKPFPCLCHFHFRPEQTHFPVNTGWPFKKYTRLNNILVMTYLASERTFYFPILSRNDGHRDTRKQPMTGLLQNVRLCFGINYQIHEHYEQ